MRKIKTAVIGAGFMGRVHTEAIRRLGGVEVAGVAAITQQEAAAFGRSMRVDRTTDDYMSLVNDPEIEAVHICTPNALHYPVAKAAIKAGKHVLCEKPMAMSVSEAKDMAKLAKSKGVVAAVNHNLRYYPVLQQIRRMI